MTSHCARAFRSRMVLIVLTLVLAAVAGVVGAWPSAGSVARSHPQPLHAGLGYRLAGGDFVGYYVTPQGSKVYCIDPGKAAPTTVSLQTVRSYADVRPPAVARLSYALLHWGDAATTRAAAVESQVVNVLVGNLGDVRRRAAALPAALRARVADHVRTARERSGSYVARINPAKPLLPGQSGVGSALVRSVNGSGLPGAAIRLSTSANARAPRWVRTDRHGAARVPYTVTGPGTVTLRASVTGLAAAVIRGTRPASGVQRMVGSAPSVTASAAASSTAGANGFSASYGCSSTCDGRPLTTLRTCAAPSDYRSRIVYRAGKRTVHRTFAASATRRCATTVLRLADGDRVTAGWTFRGGHGWTHPMPAAGGFRVDCPAVPAVRSQVVSDCAAALVRIDLVRAAAANEWVPITNHTGHRMVLLIGGSAKRAVYADSGHAASFSARVSCRRAATFTMRAGVQRTNGSWNYGPIATLTTPRVVAA